METNKDVLHKIRVYLYENYLTDNPDDYSAKVIYSRIENLELVELKQKEYVR